MNRNQSSSSSGIQLWQNQQSLQNPNILFNTAAAGGNIISSSTRRSVISTTTASAITCHDCGNQAKKDCSHRRCRTCCKSRGFDCATHVKSTWVPAARRRERQLLVASTVSVAGGSSSSTTSARVKKPRLISSQTTTSHTSTSTSARSFDTSSTHQDEYAYQAMVKIGGHVFKGFLYDQGVIDDESRSDGSLIPNISDLHLGGISSNNNNEGDGRQQGMMTSSSSPIIDHPSTSVYVKSAGSSGLFGGTDYSNQQHN
ncbi:Protein of unknown function DUF702 [Macleaya cordata]|uniref:Zinc finger protein n=1 Tax=Macleaya cordata TaxID=56857 RepID=A0A200QBJ5_MACCD|nr:Protein of unknown function DUF702 [Macleaya cordata]